MKTFVQCIYRNIGYILDTERSPPECLTEKFAGNNSLRHTWAVHTITLPFHYTSKTKFLIKYF